MADALGWLKGATRRLTTSGKHLKHRFDETHAGRMVSRYGELNGNVLAGGIAYYSLVSIAAGLVIGATVASLLAQYIPGVRDAFISVLEGALPGVVGEGDDALVSADTRLATPVTGLVGVFAFVLLMNRATRFIGGLRTAVRTMLGRGAGNPLEGKLRDFIALVAIAVIVITGVAVQVAASRAADWLVDLISDEAVSAWLLRVPAVAVGLIVDVLFVTMAIVVLGHSRARWRRLWPVLVVTAAVIGLLRIASSLLVGSAADNAVLGSIAAVITLLIFVDFTTRAILMAAAWLGSASEAHLDDVHVSDPTPSTHTGMIGRRSKVRTRRATVLRREAV